jgi:hypothetical protein
MAHITSTDFIGFDMPYYCKMAKFAVHHADGRLEAFAGSFFVSDELLRYITEWYLALVMVSVLFLFHHQISSTSLLLVCSW